MYPNSRSKFFEIDSQQVSWKFLQSDKCGGILECVLLFYAEIVRQKLHHTLTFVHKKKHEKQNAKYFRLHLLTGTKKQSLYKWNFCM